MPAPTPFKIAVPDADLEDVKRRLRETRWPDELEGVAWEYGIPLATVKKLVAHWATAFDWRAVEARLNARPQFTWPHDGVKLHFFHVKHPDPSSASRAPLLLLHGWPGSFMEFDGVVDALLAQGGFESLVIPSLPGYGFSESPKTEGWGVRKVADALHALMTDGLGIGRYNVQGGDWGALIARALGTSHPASAAAVHTNMAVARPTLSSPRTLLQALNAPFARYATPFLTKKEAAGLAAGWRYASAESGYFKLQSTRPQTLGYGLTDSPAFLCAWICEKFGAWTDTAGVPAPLPDGASAKERAAARAAVRAARLLDVFTTDQLISNVAVYWFGRTAASSVRLYKETEAAGDVAWLLRRTCTAPTGVLVMPHELFRPPRAWVAAHYNLKHWTEAEAGGHFAAMEAPGVFVEDVCAFFQRFGVERA